MTTKAHAILAAFDALPISDKKQVAAEFLRRITLVELLPQESLEELAVDLFRGYDAEEALPCRSTFIW
jgi:hypothetical protein